MKRILYSTALMLALLATGCGDANQKPSGLPQIDMNADYPEKEICLQDVRADTLKLVLSEVLRDLKKKDMCYIKYELKQGCFHITAR